MSTCDAWLLDRGKRWTAWKTRGSNDPRKILQIIRLAEQFDPQLYVDLMGYPAELPDLSRKRPPAGNTRPDGIPHSCFASRTRSELPDTYCGPPSGASLRPVRPVGLDQRASAGRHRPASALLGTVASFF
jgi:hypothetical protein